MRISDWISDVCSSDLGGVDLLVVFGDCPLMTGETLERLVAARRQAAAPDIVGLAFRPSDPATYGRVVLDEVGRIARIVEFADPDSAERQIARCHPGIGVGHPRPLFALITRPGRPTAQETANADGRKTVIEDVG